ncbi:hypothetical protein [Clostridium estertheticum]|uniref:Glycine zipper family protein n=1 Tax=Clostridium estertheticum TaxID=238834 RepID=A0A7Y3T1D1_9CLOT|nr:hypothetical protein [Clostridium estertheticum]NNU78352.1 hypothetical protein [Clostridium estertheticum]WBL45294.1 hypothetical protein LOR37_11320 [Clostridium estertheticum]
MNFIEKKQNMARYLDKMYRNMLEEIVLCRKLDTVKGTLDLEHKKLCNYIFAIKDEFQTEIFDEFSKEKNENRSQIESSFDEVAKNFTIPKVSVSEDTFFDIRKVNQTTVESVSSKDGQGIFYTTLGVLGGAIIGGGIGVLVGRVVIPVVVGGIVGGGIGSYKDREIAKENHNYSRPVAEMSRDIVEKKLSPKRAKLFIENRNEVIKNIFIEYIDRYESIYTKLQ